MLGTTHVIFYRVKLSLTRRYNYFPEELDMTKIGATMNIFYIYDD